MQNVMHCRILQMLWNAIDAMPCCDCFAVFKSDVLDPFRSLHLSYEGSSNRTIGYWKCMTIELSVSPCLIFVEICLTIWLWLVFFNAFQLVPLMPFRAFLLNASTSFSLERSLSTQNTMGDKLIRLKLGQYSKYPITSAFYVFPLCTIKTLCFSLTNFPCKTLISSRAWIIIQRLTALPSLPNNACKQG